jgi:hypothetical protein
VHLHLDRRIAAGVQDLPAHDVFDAAHGALLLLLFVLRKLVDSCGGSSTPTRVGALRGVYAPQCTNPPASRRAPRP